MYIVCILQIFVSGVYILLWCYVSVCGLLRLSVSIFFGVKLRVSELLKYINYYLISELLNVDLFQSSCFFVVDGSLTNS